MNQFITISIIYLLMFASCSNPTPKTETASYIDSVSRSVKQERLIEFAKNENASLELNMTRLRKATIEYQDFVKSNDKFIINNFRVLDVLRVSDDKISLTITKARTKGFGRYGGGACASASSPDRKTRAFFLSASIDACKPLLTLQARSGPQHWVVTHASIE